MNSFLSKTGHSLAALGISILGIALSPAVANVLPAKTALILSIVGVAYQALTGQAIQIAQEPAPAPVIPQVQTVVIPAPVAAPAPAASPVPAGQVVVTTH